MGSLVAMVGACAAAPEEDRVATQSASLDSANVEAWLVNGVAGINFTRVTRPTPDAPSAGCSSVFASNVQVFVLASAVTAPSFTFQVNSVVSASYGSYNAGERYFDSSMFTPSTRPISGEAILVAPGSDIEIERTCQGDTANSAQTTTFRQGSDRANAEERTRLMHVLSLPKETLLRAEPCIQDDVYTGPYKFDIIRCASAMRNELELRVLSEVNRGDGGIPDLLYGRKYTAWVSLNGESKTFPMHCARNSPGRYSPWDCRLTISSEPKATAFDDEGYVVDASLFRWARNGSQYLNAWEVQFALFDEEGNWVKRDGSNFAGRIGVRTLP